MFRARRVSISTHAAAAALPVLVELAMLFRVYIHNPGVRLVYCKFWLRKRPRKNTEGTKGVQRGLHYRPWHHTYEPRRGADRYSPKKPTACHANIVANPPVQEENEQRKN